MNESEILDIPRRLIDTNIIIRYLVGDGGDHALKARELFQKATDRKVILVIQEIVFIEAVHVLKSYYKQERAIIAKVLRDLVRLPGVEIKMPISVLSKSLENFEMVNAPWPDALIAAYALEEDMPVYSFDGHFDKFNGIRKLIP